MRTNKLAHNCIQSQNEQTGISLLTCRSYKCVESVSESVSESVCVYTYNSPQIEPTPPPPSNGFEVRPNKPNNTNRKSFLQFVNPVRNVKQKAYFSPLNKQTTQNKQQPQIKYIVLYKCIHAQKAKIGIWHIPQFK